VHDPEEGISPEGFVVTGARRSAVPAAFEPVLADAASRLRPEESLYLYGSVATGRARVGVSDVDLVVLGRAPVQVSHWAAGLSAAYPRLCREVAVGTALPEDYEGEGDRPYGNRVFLRHYCVWVSGPDRHSHLPRYLADARAARGFNGDLAACLERWRDEAGRLAAGQLATRVARKTLFGLAGLVSVHDRTWTTDGAGAARRWAELHPQHRQELDALVRWGQRGDLPDEGRLRAALDGIVPEVTTAFSRHIGLWPPESAPGQA
jgi:uncharacterized protein